VYTYDQALLVSYHNAQLRTIAQRDALARRAAPRSSRRRRRSA
jgi:hypothetical protein